LSAHGTPIEPGAAARSRASGDQPQLKLGRYEVVRELGKGAMGIVYLAKDPLIGRLVALKTIRAAMHADDDEAKEFQQRFIREAQAAGILNHPAIVTVHDIGQDDASNTSFIAMEYVEGQNLKEVLNQGRALSFDQIADIVAQVAEALDFAHAKGIVHRDVKPANIILLDGYRAKITDFGIAKIASGAANLTTTGLFLGTPNYMAPEQVKGAPVDGRTDIFALGICLYECLTRRKPFGGDSLTSISYKIVHEPFPPLHEINPQIPEAFEEVVANCLAKDPAKRYQRARDLSNALRAVIRGDRPTPRLTEPALAEETMVTRDRGDRPQQPTLEVPFPQAMEASPAPSMSNTRPASASVMPSVTEVVPIPTMPPVAQTPVSPPTVARPMPVPPPPAKPQPQPPRGPRTPVSEQLRTTLTNVRALPLWRRRIPPSIFIAIVALFVIALLSTVVALRAQQPVIPVVDTKLEARRARERQLRLEGERLLTQGRVSEAYTKYEELQRLAPKSPFVANMMQKLNAIRQQEEVSRQAIAEAQARYQEGMALLGQKKYPEAIERLQLSFSLNPNSIETAEALKNAQLEQQKAAEAARLAKLQQQQRPGGGRQPKPGPVQQTATTATQAPVPVEPSQIITIFSHPFTDGRIMVRIGGDIVANEQLYTERRRKVIGTVVRERRPIAVSNSFPAKSADVEVMITVPTAKISERHTIPGARFESGSSYRLTVRYDATSKRFTYELN
jgi:serine/threonine protein kinase